jgi:hypothetical protein
MCPYSEEAGFTRPPARLAGLLAAAIICIQGPAVQALAQAPDQEARVRQRISGYFDAMLKSDIVAALQFVHPDSRNLFLQESRDASYRNYEIKRLVFSDDGKTCNVEITVNIMVAMFGTSIDWTLSGQWVESEGEWYMLLRDDPQGGVMQQLFRNAELSAGKSIVTEVPTPVPPDRRPISGGGKTELRLAPDPSNPGVVHFGEKAVFRFHYRNDTPEPIKIVAAYADCHCTSVGKEHPEVAPGQNGTLEVTLDTFGLPLGAINKDIGVQFSDLEKSQTVVIAATNVPNFRVEPEAVDFGRVEVGRTVEKTVTFRNESGRKVKILSTLKSYQGLEIATEKSGLEPGESMAIRFRMMPRSAGEMLDIVMLQIDLPAEPIVNIKVRWSSHP